MSEKVKLPKEICDALDLLKQDVHSDEIYILRKTKAKIWALNSPYTVLNDQEFQIIMRALVLGYKPEENAEEQIKKLYNDFNVGNVGTEFWDFGYCEGVRDALRIHGIHYDWLK